MPIAVFPPFFVERSETMLLKDILEEADLYVPNALSQEQKIRFINETQRKLYRDFPLAEAAHTFQTVPGTFYYAFPWNVTDEQVTAVFIGDKEYHYQTLEDTRKSNVYTLLEGQLFVQPTPTDVLSGYVQYKKRPTDLTINDLANEVPSFPDYHELLVLGCAQKLAIVEKDFKAAGEFEVRYQNLVMDAIRKTKRIKIKRVRQVRGWS